MENDVHDKQSVDMYSSRCIAISRGGKIHTTLAGKFTSVYPFAMSDAPW